jgi:hypothetical protein
MWWIGRAEARLLITCGLQMASNFKRIIPGPTVGNGADELGAVTMYRSCPLFAKAWTPAPWLKGDDTDIMLGARVAHTVTDGNGASTTKLGQVISIFELEGVRAANACPSATDLGSVYLLQILVNRSYQVDGFWTPIRPYQPVAGSVSGEPHAIWVEEDLVEPRSITEVIRIPDHEGSLHNLTREV